MPDPMNEILAERDPDRRSQLLRDAASGATRPSQPAGSRRTIGSSPRNATVSFEQALEWWNRPLFRSQPSHFESEVVIVGSHDGGTKGNPSQSTSRVDIWYGKSGFAPEEHTFFELFDAGALLVSVIFYNDSSWLPSAPADGEVIVGGNVWQVRTLRRPDANVDWRRMTRADPQPNGAVLLWDVSSSSVKWSDEAVAKAIEQLRLVSPINR